jgi:DNA-binding transcriptional LysR family regulator
MELRQLEIFRALAEELHFTRAAARVHCVQSNVTTQIQALEQELGSCLVDRLAKKVVLTDAGRRLLPYAEKILEGVKEARFAVGKNTVPSGPLRIGAPESVLSYRLPGVLARFRKLYPKVELIFRPYSTESLVRSIENGKLDAVVVMQDCVEDERLKFLRLRTEQVLFIGSFKHPLARKRRMQPEDLNGQKLLLTEAGCSYRKKLDEMISSRNLRPENITEFSSVEAIKECVMLGMGLGLLPEIVVAKEIARNQIVKMKWTGPAMDIATHVVWHKDKWVSPALGAFLTIVEAELAHGAKGPRESAA